MVWYSRLKLVLWPHVLVPVGLVVALQYAAVLAAVAQACLGIYLALQVATFAVGFYSGLMGILAEGSAWARLEAFKNIPEVFPLIDVGARASQWLFEESEQEP